MLYFFHNYELPAIEHQIHGRRDEEAYLDEAVQMIVEGIELVAGQNTQNEPDNPETNENQVNQNPTNQNAHANGETGAVAVDGTHVREVSTNDNGNRVFVFSGEGPFIQMVRDFIRQVHLTVNVTGNPNPDPDPVQAEAEPNNEQVSAVSNESEPAQNASDIEFDYSATQIRPELDVLVQTFPNELEHSTNTENESLNALLERDFDEEQIDLTTVELHADNVYKQVQSMPQNYPRQIAENITVNEYVKENQAEDDMGVSNTLSAVVDSCHTNKKLRISSDEKSCLTEDEQRLSFLSVDNEKQSTPPSESKSVEENSKT